MESKSSAQESSEPNDDEDTKDEVDNKDEDDELETQCWGHYHFNSHSNSRLRETVVVNVFKCTYLNSTIVKSPSSS